MIIFALILIFIAGLSNGICDSIAQHDSYAKYGYWWSIDSWKDKKILGQFVLNAWHIFKFTMVLSFVGAAILCLYDEYHFQNWWYVLIQFFVFVFIFSAGFKVSYR